MAKYRFVLNFPVEIEAENVAQAFQHVKRLGLICSIHSREDPQKPRMVVAGRKRTTHDRDFTSYTIEILRPSVTFPKVS